MEFIGDLDGTVSLSLCWGRCLVRSDSYGGRKPKALLLRGALWGGGRGSGRRWRNRILGATPDPPSQNARLNKIARESAREALARTARPTEKLCHRPEGRTCLGRRLSRPRLYAVGEDPGGRRKADSRCRESDGRVPLLGKGAARGPEPAWSAGPQEPRRRWVWMLGIGGGGGGGAEGRRARGLCLGRLR